MDIIHVAGTKGKGSTCSFVDSILRGHRLKTGYPPKVGLYTSPHIKHVRERIQINSEPITEECFTKYFFKIWDKIAPGDKLDPSDKPGYFRFLTLMSFDVFLEEKVTVAIYEVGVGGENDSTNIIEAPVATGITKLGIDHEKTLRVPAELRPTYFTMDRNGDQRTTLEEIAWHKSGIFKTGCPAFSIQQEPVAKNILCCRAIEKGVTLQFVDTQPELLMTNFPTDVHKEIAALAIALANTFLSKRSNVRLDSAGIPNEVIQSLESSRLPGRCHIFRAGIDTWYLDGAHTQDSVIVAGRWYTQMIKR